MPGLVPGIHLSANGAARRSMDPGNKCRDDNHALGTRDRGSIKVGRLYPCTRPIELIASSIRFASAAQNLAKSGWSK